jgi:peroxiredoxin
MTNLYELPPDLPVPLDDGAADHLRGLRLPSVPLSATSGRSVDLAALPGLTIAYIYPRTGKAGETITEDWNVIPGARGCTPQSCAFRDHYAELKALGAEVFGLSAQSTDDQQEAAERLHLPFDLLSDRELAFGRALKLPTFEWHGQRLLKRLTLVLRDGIIEHVFYPVFPPDQNAANVVAWLQAQPD